YFGENEQGSQQPMLNVFRRDGEEIRHFWGSELMFAPTDPGQDSRHVDLITPLWNVFDCTPEGRPTEWRPKLSYSQTKGEKPRLKEAPISPYIPVADLQRARKFYEEKVGLGPGKE